MSAVRPPPSIAPAANVPQAPGSSPSATATNTAGLSAAQGAKSTPVDDDIDLDLEQRAKVAYLFDNLEVLDYYAMLGVERGADKKLVKRAYYELAASFHPDRFFRKNLGDFKPKMETIFGRLTIAHDTLTSKTERVEYDAYLGVKATVRDHESKLAGASDEIRKAEEDLHRAARQNVPISVAPPPIVEAPRAPTAPPPTTAFTPNKAFDVQAAREALARKLRGGAPGRPSSPGIAAPIMTNAPASGAASSSTSSGVAVTTPGAPLNSRDAVEALKRRYEDRVQDSRTSQVQKYKSAGEASIAKGDFVAAVNALRVALSFDPENAELEALTNETQLKADELLADNYEKQAQYEEKNDQWGAAARSWGRVARARPTNAHAQERAAHAGIRSQGNVREAAEFAKRAVALEPKNGAYHAILALAYLGGGLLLNAKREIEIAVQLAPTDPTVLSAVKRIKDAG